MGFSCLRDGKSTSAKSGPEFATSRFPVLDRKPHQPQCSAENFHKPPRQPHSVTTQADPCNKTWEQIPTPTIPCFRPQCKSAPHSMFVFMDHVCIYVFMDLLPDRKERECLTHARQQQSGKSQSSCRSPRGMEGYAAVSQCLGAHEHCV